MQARTNIQSNQLGNYFSLRYFIIGLLFCSGMLITNQAKAQLGVKVEEILMFSPPTGNHTFGFNFQKSPDIQISPNPATDQITIRKEQGVELERLEIRNTQGNIIFSGQFLHDLLNVPNIGPGLYSFRIYSTQGVVNKWVSIE